MTSCNNCGRARRGMTLAALFASLASAAIAMTDEEKIAAMAAVRPAPRQAEWQALELTAFFHFGMNTFTGKEWGDGKTPAAVFNPTDLDCEEWVKAVKDSGFKLAILVAKHHDGFCLWPSKYTDYSVKNSPWKGGKGDVVKEFTAACRKHGIRAGIYLSPWDRHEASYGSDDYNVYFLNQLKELGTNYGRIDEFWFDGACGEGPNGKKQSYAWNAYYALIREMQPQAVIAVSGPDVRWVGNEGGMARESEWSVVPTRGDANANDNDAIRKAFENYHFEGVDPAKMADIVKPAFDGRSKDLGSRAQSLKSEAWAWAPAECDTSIRPGWFYHSEQDGQVKSLEKLKTIYYSSVGRNAVLLLNVPPDRRGRIAKPDLDRLAEFGAFVKNTFAKPVAPKAKPVKKNGFFGLDLGAERTFDVIMAGEDIAKGGQVVERFHVEAKIGGKWETIATSTTIGWKRLVKLPAPVTARALKLVVDESRAEPVIRVFNVFKER